MASPPDQEITALLRAWAGGDGQALERLTPLLYQELRRAARRCLARARRGQTLETAALINELYLKLVGMNHIGWQNRAHFLAVCARQMRWIVTDLYRAKQVRKRGAGAALVPFDESAVLRPGAGRELLAIDAALERLAAVDERKSRVVELRFFGGLTADETAAALQVSSKTVRRDWEFARAWLQRELTRGDARDA